MAVPLVAAAAVALMSGCRSQDMQRCVDENNHVVDQSFCAGQGQQPQRRSDGHGGFFFVPMPYRYYYGGTGGFDRGSTVSGGSYAPLPGRSYTTTRGGFGRFFSGGGDGHAGGEGGGHSGGSGE